MRRINRTTITKAYTMLMLILATATTLLGQRYEAESAILSGGAVKVANSSASGGYIVQQNEGNIKFSITLAESGFYNLSINYSAPDDKPNNVVIDGSGLVYKFTQRAQLADQQVLTAVRLQGGSRIIEITKSWGWINVDYITLTKVEATDRFDTDLSLVTPNATDEAQKLYQFLLDNYGKRICSGAMTLNSMDEINWLKTNTGKEPVVMGLDLMHTGRNYSWYNENEPINDAINWYNRNGIPTITWHWRDPLRTTEKFYTSETTFDVSKISDPESAEYKAIIADIDYTAGLLKKLQDAGVPVIWRPLHEAAGGWFWWGAKEAEPCKALYLLMFDRMVNTHGLRNLIWVWTSEPGDDLWYPGDEYVDIVGRDIYKDGDHTSQHLEFTDLNERYNHKKMITLSECGSFPDVDNLIKDGAAWSWYMPWYGDYVENAKYNTLALWQKMFDSEYVLTLDEMPVLKNYTQTTVSDIVGIRTAVAVGTTKLYPTIVQKNLTVESVETINIIEFFSLTGQLMQTVHPQQTSTTIDLRHLQAGMYIVRINRATTSRIIVAH